MARAAGLRPLGQVTGVCVCQASHIRGHGLTATYPPGGIYRYRDLIEAVIQSRRRALRRLSDGGGAGRAAERGSLVITPVRHVS